MPPGGKLPAGEIEILTRWVKDGLPWSDRSRPPPIRPRPRRARVRRPPRPIAAARREWSHRPVVRPPVPAVKDRGWVRNPIDAFLLARLEAERLAPGARGRPRDLDPPAHLRPDRPAADPRGGRRLPRRSRAGRLRAPGRPAARLAPLRREVGPALARPGPLRRDQRLRARLGQAVRLAVSRLCDRRLQPRQAVRPVHPRATGRRRDRPRLGRGPDRDRLLSPGHLGRRAGRPAAGPLRRARRHHLHHRPGLPGDDGQLRPLPRPQGRPDPPDTIITGCWRSFSDIDRPERQEPAGKSPTGPGSRIEVMCVAERGRRRDARAAARQPDAARRRGRAGRARGARRRLADVRQRDPASDGRWPTG